MACGPSWGASSLASTMPTELCVVPFEKRFTTVLSAAALLPAAAVRIAPARAVATKVQASGTSVHLKRRRLMDFASGFTVPKPSTRQLCFWFTRDDMGGRHGAKLERILVRMKRVTPLPRSWSGLTRPPRLFLRPHGYPPPHPVEGSVGVVAGTSPATTPVK